MEEQAAVYGSTNNNNTNQVTTQKQNNAFEDFFECSEIDNQDYSEFINDQSQFIIGQNGNEIDDAVGGEERSNKHNNNQRRGSTTSVRAQMLMKRPETQTDDINYIDVNNIVSLIRQEDQQREQQQQQQQLQNQHQEIQVQRNDNGNDIDNKQYQEEPQIIIHSNNTNIQATTTRIETIQTSNYQQQIVISTNTHNQQEQQQQQQLVNRNSRRITKETMMLEPLPIFDCMFCIKESKLVFQRISEKALNKKYANMKRSIDQQQEITNNINHGSIGNFSDKQLSQDSIENFLSSATNDVNHKIIIDDQRDPDLRYVQDSLQLQIMIQNLPLNYIAQYSNNQSQFNQSPRQYNNRSLLTLQSNVTQFLMLPSVKVSVDVLNTKGQQLKNRLSSMILQSRLRHNQTYQAMEDNRNNYMTSPTFLGHENHHTSSHLNTLMFNTMTGGGLKASNMRDNLVIKDFILEEGNQYFEENVTIEKWARTQRQRKLMNISFESEVHNIYNPRFSSEGSCSRSVSSLERSIYHDFVPPTINIRSDSNSVDSNSSSSPSVAEERDTISITPNAITPNLSRIMNICSISKIEQPSILTADSDLTPASYRAPKSQLSHNKTKPNRIHLFQRSHQQATTQSCKKSDIIDDTPIVECLLIQEPLRYKQRSNYQLASSSKNKKLHLSQISNVGDNLKVGSLFTRGSGRNVSNIIMSQNHVKVMNNNYKTEPNNDSLMQFASSSVQNTLLYQEFSKSIDKQSSPIKVLSKIRQQQTTSGKYQTKTTGITGTKSKKKKISIDKTSNNKNKLSIDNNMAALMKRNSSNQLLNLEQSSILNPYETLYNSPNHLNFMDKSTTVGGENRNSLLTTGATDVKNLQDKSRLTTTNVVGGGGKKSASSVMRNSQSMSNLNLQPRAFITRNVKMRKNNNQSTFAVGHNYPLSASEFMITPQNNFTRRQIDEQMREELERQSSIQPPEQHQTSMQTVGLLLTKKEQVNQLKKQRLARDILLSKVYNSNHQQLVMNTHKKTNTLVSGNSSQLNQQSMQHMPTHQSQGSYSKITNKPNSQSQQQSYSSNFKASLKKHAVMKMIIDPSNMLTLNQQPSMSSIRTATGGDNILQHQSISINGSRNNVNQQQQSLLQPHTGMSNSSSSNYFNRQQPNNIKGSIVSRSIASSALINNSSNTHYTQVKSINIASSLVASNNINQQTQAASALQKPHTNLQSQSKTKLFSQQQSHQSKLSASKFPTQNSKDGSGHVDGDGQLNLIYNSQLPSINNFLK